MSAERRVLVLGAGVTGLAAGYTSGCKVYEQAERPGGICSSYYVSAKTGARLASTPADGEAYRFEVGGGHWIFGAEPVVLRFIDSVAPVESYERRSAVFLPDRDLFVPYPIQNHLRYLGGKVALRVLEEIMQRREVPGAGATMAEWLLASFGPTLYQLFFEPFHELYTAGLFREISAQDIYKTPVDPAVVLRGAFEEVPRVGYNTTFVYPSEGLNVLVGRMAEQCQVYYEKRVVRIDPDKREVYFEDGWMERYDRLISTLPLKRVVEMTGLRIDERPDPATSVLVVNIGAAKGRRCPGEHWVYVTRSRAGFHRVGFYSNVDAAFLPESARESADRVGIYVEKAYREGEVPNDSEVDWLVRETVSELREWGWIDEVEVVDVTWIETAYTWSWPGSRWREKAVRELERYGIYQAGRYGRWRFQGIAESIREGLLVGVVLGRRAGKE